MAEAAEGPVNGVGRDCGRAFEIPDTASAFEDGQSPLACFFRCIHPSRSACTFTSGLCEAGLLSDVSMDTVESKAEDEPDAVEDSDDEEFFFSRPFLGINIRVTSSALMEFKPP